MRVITTDILLFVSSRLITKILPATDSFRRLPLDKLLTTLNSQYLAELSSDIGPVTGNGREVEVFWLNLRQSLKTLSPF